MPGAEAQGRASAVLIAPSSARTTMSCSNLPSTQCLTYTKQKNYFYCGNNCTNVCPTVNANCTRS
eukprot:1157935-Pelagomonas_calceolata.AAC.6